MKVLLAHNFYRSSSPSGEDVVYRAEKALLESRGFAVVPYERHNDEIEQISIAAKLSLPPRLIWSTKTYRELTAILRAEEPDVAHFHNIHYLISPSAYSACQDAGIPVVQTLHNFRIFCINGLFLWNGSICEECLAKIPWRGIARACFHNSRPYSLAMTAMVAFHRVRRTWERTVDACIALSEFSRAKYIQGGLPADRIFVKPNFLAKPPEPTFGHQGFAVYLGRLSAEKGLPTLVEAMASLDAGSRYPLRLKIIGDGPLKQDLEARVKDRGVEHAKFLGLKSHEECMGLLRNARFLVLPSICYEGFPMTVIEAFACGKPVIVSNRGSLAEIVEDGRTGLLFEPENPKDLASKIKWMLENEDARMEMGRNARRVFEEKYTAEKNFEILTEIYRFAMETHRGERTQHG